MAFNYILESMQKQTHRKIWIFHMQHVSLLCAFNYINIYKLKYLQNKPANELISKHDVRKDTRIQAIGY